MPFTHKVEKLRYLIVSVTFLPMTLSNPHLGCSGALLPHLLLPGAWRGAGLPLRGWLQQDLQQVLLSVENLAFPEAKTLLMCTDWRGGVRANIKVTRRDTTVSSMHR